MNTAATILATMSALAAVALFVASIIAERRRRLAPSDNDPVKNSYVRRLVRALDDEGPAADRITASTPRRRMALAEAMHLIMRHTYGVDTAQLREVVDRNALDRFLLRRIARSRGTRRAYLLTLLGSVPSHGDIAARIGRYTASRNADVRIRALLAMLAACPSMAVRTIAAYPHRLTPLDVAQIVALLRRGLLPIAFEPLLANSNPNLRMLGMSIVRCFGIETADRSLCNIVASDPDPAIVREAVYTLASLGRPLTRTRIRERLALLSPTQRKELCRHLVIEGYSLQTVRTLLTREETLYAESLINSHKRDLVCR